MKFLPPDTRYPIVMTSPLRETLCACLLLLALPCFSQKPVQTNLVPNPGFELFSDKPSGWYYSGKDFSRIALYWTSPNDSSPDLYAPLVAIPQSWKLVGFGSTKSYAGNSHAGITIYGCGQGKPHCREYIQVQLTEPLVPGQRYGFSCMVSHLPKSVVVKNIELAFSEHELEQAGHEHIQLTPALELDRWLPSDGKWYKWTGHFEANSSASYLIIGNFKNDDKSEARISYKSELRFGYYYLDEIRLFKIPPIIIAPVVDSPLSDFVPKEGNVVSLSKIYFEHDRSDFMPQALIQLRQLFDFLKKYPDIKVEIIGHTDNVGTSEYNQSLSERRSAAVVTWLVSKGISRTRMISSGLGRSMPVSTNTTSIGRSQNRRVEIKVISL